MKQVVQIKITLEEIHPPIWRRVLVDETSTLADLHSIIQQVMGWTNSHLHQFTIHGECYDPNPEDEDMHTEAKDEHDYTISQLMSYKVKKFDYDYDFGDGWRHTIIFEHIDPKDPAKKYPLCIQGERSCPPEDVGGPHGYLSMLIILRGPKSAEKDRYIEWLGGSFSPDEFDLKKANRGLAKILPDRVTTNINWRTN